MCIPYSQLDAVRSVPFDALTGAPCFVELKHGSSADFDASLNVVTVTISKSEHELLVSLFLCELVNLV